MLVRLLLSKPISTLVVAITNRKILFVKILGHVYTTLHLNPHSWLLR